MSIRRRRVLVVQTLALRMKLWGFSMKIISELEEVAEVNVIKLAE
jgi:hypothetical protein